MSESEGEQTARSIALEQVYVHEVYEQCAEKTAQSRHWPKVYKFLEELEPGALVCDIGCGNGKYLTINNNIFQVGADKCKKFTEIARQKNNEILICDNLVLPFRDESFDAVLSIAVVHHFATTERRVNALRELARVLRIGGKLVISVWAMEQRHKKFESQDVLIPWPKAYCLNSTCNCGTKIPCDDEQCYHLTPKSVLASKREQKYKCRQYKNDPFVNSSPSTSSLSSPNETCYSFFRRALQKLAGKKSVSHRPWFFDSFHNISCKNHDHGIDSDDNSDIDDIPIELRRLENDNVRLNKQNDTFSIKSKSLGDILEIQHLDLVRTRSSNPDLWSTVTLEEKNNDRLAQQTSLEKYKSRLTKQKSCCIEDTYSGEALQITSIREFIKNLPELQANTTKSRSRKHPNIIKQSSMNEELMSIERLAERDHVRHKIIKQISLNEEFIYKNKTMNKVEDDISNGTSRRFQLLKSGLTNRIKQSTTNVEKVSSIAIKNGLVKILQSWKSLDGNSDDQTDNKNLEEPTTQPEENASLTTLKKETEIERFSSKEDGSDSSKDSSLQSDTSVDSEDSFASVIYVPKKQILPIDVTATPSSQLRATSAPPSPRIKHPPDFHKPKIKMMKILPLLKQFPATSKSLPPPSPPGLSPKTFNSNTQSFFHHRTVAYNFDKPASKQLNELIPINSELNSHTDVTNAKDPIIIADEDNSPIIQENNSKEEINQNELSLKDHEPSPNSADSDNSILIQSKCSIEFNKSPNESLDKSNKESFNDEDSRKCRLNQIKELLQQKPGFATRCSKPAFPLVRRASTATVGRLEAVAKTLPRLLSLELFNPETDDLDSDSSGVSSPDSVDSVVSVISDERFTKEIKILQTKQLEASEVSKINKNSTNNSDESAVNNDREQLNESTILSISASSSQSLRILERSASLGSYNESSVDKLIELRSESKVFSKVPSHTHISNSSINNNETSIYDDIWNKKYNDNLIDFTEKITENLINDIDHFCKERSIEIYNDITIDNTTEPNSNSSLAQQISSLNTLEETPKFNSMMWLKNQIGDHFSKSTNKFKEDDHFYGIDSEDTMGFVMVSKTGEVEENEKYLVESKLITDEKKNNQKLSQTSRSNKNHDSTDLSDSSTSYSSPLVFQDSNDVEYKFIENKRICPYNKKSKSEDKFRDNKTNTSNRNNYSESSSQESLPSEREGGAITYHQYYHVFREGELDQLINKYVENLHIISSYYDHANWCIVAEKVQVWTI
ncbi:hypothetical protein G9C98_008573 [Cotesia typhae]|uniref:Methyltransferase type 11 domain-containing protein n=1 Tax=Cotesia typhae TaxID=2053667 RepID=A0A8J5QSC3_9HYME|nr:hypothetical protein G9C98_008573 [Cotesia typhae]